MTMPSLKHRVYQALEYKETDNYIVSIINWVLIIFILVNVMVASLETVPELAASYENSFTLFENIATLVFTVEYFLRVWVSSENPAFKNRFSYLLSTSSIIDLVCILPFYLSIFFDSQIKVLIILRLFRLFKLVRYFKPLEIMGSTIKAELHVFLPSLFILFILIMIAASGMYFLEKDIQPKAFGSIPQAMWWSVVTLTTLGYGDVVPATLGGKIFASLITILSIGTVALPTGALASRFSEELSNRKKQFKEIATELQKKGSLCSEDLKTLNASRENMCLSKDEADELIKDACSKNQKHCPHCGKDITG